MGYSEFPHANYEDTDFSELIEYYEEVRAKYDGTLRQITETNNRLAEYEKNVDARINGSVESAIETYKGIVSTEINRRFAQLTQDVNNRLQGMEESISEFKKETNNTVQNFIDSEIAIRTKFEVYVKNELNEMSEDTLEANNSVVRLIGLVQQQLTSGLESLEEYIDDEIATLKNMLPTGLPEIKWLWDNALHDNGFSAYEWYMYATVSCEDWNKSEVTCSDWYTNGKYVFDWYNSEQKFFSPVTGERVDASRAIIELASALNVNAITAEEYDSLRLTADEFDRMFFKSGSYDWTAKLLYTNMFDSRTERSIECSQENLQDS